MYTVKFDDCLLGVEMLLEGYDFLVVPDYEISLSSYQ